MALVRLVAHPPAVMTHILGKPLRALAVPRGAAGDPCARFRVRRRQTGKARRDLDQRLRDRHRDRVQVRPPGAQSQPLRLQRDRPAAAERVDDRRRLCGEKGVDLRPGLRRRNAQTARDRARDLPPRIADDARIVRVLPLRQFLDDAEQPPALPVLRRFVGELFGERGGVRPPSGRTAPPGTPPAACAPTTDAASTDARAGSTSLAPKPHSPPPKATQPRSTFLWVAS